MNHHRKNVRASASPRKRVKVNPSRSSRLMDSKESAERLRLDERTGTRWDREGYIPRTTPVEGNGSVKASHVRVTGGETYLINQSEDL